MNSEIFKNKEIFTGGPSYVFDLDELKARIYKIQDKLPKRTKLAFAIKANPFLASYASKLTDRLEICSFGEYMICKNLGIHPDKMLISGVLKQPDDFNVMLSDCGSDAIFTAESENQFDFMDKWSAENQQDIHVYIRLTSGNQFGVDISVFEKIVKNNQNPYIHIDGIHYFTGTQKRKFDKILEEFILTSKEAKRLNDEFGANIKTIEFGPGFRVDYFDAESDMSVSDEEWKRLAEAMDTCASDFEVRLEMGRFIAASCGCYITKIMDRKVNKGHNFLIVDGGIHQMNYDGQIKGMYVPEIMHISEGKEKGKSDKGEKYTVCGSLCTINDILVGNLELDSPELGDYLVFMNTGAYSVTEGMVSFLSHELTRVFIYDNENGLKLARDRYETFRLNQERK